MSVWPALSLFHPPPLLGIDLGATHARVVACTRRHRSWRLQRWASAPLEPGSVVEGRILQFEALAERLKDLVASMDSGRRIALALPQELVRRRLLTLPPGLGPLKWRRWICEQAEQLGGRSASDLAFDVEMRPGAQKGAQLVLSVCALEAVEDWQGLAEAAGLEVALLDDRLRSMHLALRVLGLATGPEGAPALALAAEDSCRLVWWPPGELPREQLLGENPGQPLPASGWLVGAATDCRRWEWRLKEQLGGDWPVLDPLVSLHGPEDMTQPEDASGYLVALGLAMRERLS